VANAVIKAKFCYVPLSQFSAPFILRGLQALITIFATAVGDASGNINTKPRR
jgi:hypothetical protein